MAITNITMNLSALNNLSSPNISIPTSNIFDSVFSSANSNTGGYLIFASLFIIMGVVFYILSNKDSSGDFAYSDVRALNLGFGICTLIGLKLVEIGWSNNFFAVGMFGTLWVTSFFIILIYENRE